MVFSTSLLVMHLVSTCFMLGVIWFVQVVHYPLLAKVGTQQFPAYEKLHCRLTALVVGPAMLTEAVTAILLFFLLDSVPRSLLLVNLVCIVLIWFSTYLLQVPAHARLENVFDERTHSRLLVSNWLRTFLWSVRVLLVVAIMISLLHPAS